MRIQLNDEDSVQAVSCSPDITFRVAASALNCGPPGVKTKRPVNQ